jgi:hypothetical protein
MIVRLSVSVLSLSFRSIRVGETSKPPKFSSPLSPSPIASFLPSIDNLTSFPLLTLAKASSGIFNNPGEPANTYRKHCIPSTSRYWQFLLKRFHQCVRYSNETLEFWLIVQKLFKGKGVNFFRGFKAQGLNTMNESLSSISPIDCRINFSVPSNPTLSKETFKYTLDAGSPGLLNIPLDAFANVNKGKDVKLSIDCEKLAFNNKFSQLFNSSAHVSNRNQQTLFHQSFEVTFHFVYFFDSIDECFL